MKVNKGSWYFRSTNLGNDDDNLSSIIIPVDKITGFTPGNNSVGTGASDDTGSTSTMTIHYKNDASSRLNTIDGVPTQNGYITLNITNKKIFEVMSALASAASSSNSVTQVIWDEATGERLANAPIEGIATIGNL